MGFWCVPFDVCSAIGSSPALTEFVIVGDVFLQNVYTIFDFGYPFQVHFADLVLVQ